MLCWGNASPACFESQTLVQSVMSARFFHKDERCEGKEKLSLMLNYCLVLMTEHQRIKFLPSAPSLHSHTGIQGPLSFSELP